MTKDRPMMQSSYQEIQTYAVKPMKDWKLRKNTVEYCPET